MCPGSRQAAIGPISLKAGSGLTGFSTRLYSSHLIVTCKFGWTGDVHGAARDER